MEFESEWTFGDTSWNVQGISWNFHVLENKNKKHIPPTTKTLNFLSEIPYKNWYLVYPPYKLIGPEPFERKFQRNCLEKDEWTDDSQELLSHG